MLVRLLVYAPCRSRVTVPSAIRATCRRPLSTYARQKSYKRNGRTGDGGRSWWWSSRAGYQHNARAYWTTASGWLLLGNAPLLDISPVSGSIPRLSIQATASASNPTRTLDLSTIDDRASSFPTTVLSLVTQTLSAALSAFRISWRFLQLAVLFGPVIITFPIWYLFERGTIKLGLTPRLWWVNYLVWSFEVSGPTFTKLGQWASSRTDLFPPYVCEILAKLQSHVSPHSFGATRKVIKREYGMDLEDMFEDFDPKPIGVGAIAQVYKAKLRPSPSLPSGSSLRCAVKVLHPGVENIINADLIIMHAVASLINLLPDAQWLSFPDEVQMFGVMMREQLDLRLEAGNLVTFIHNFACRPRVGFPAPYPHLCRKTVLLEEFLDALPIRRFLDNGRTVYDKEIGHIGLDSFLRMLVMDNFVHADLHPGNIYVTLRKPRTDAPMFSLFKEHPFEPCTPSDFMSLAELSALSSLPPEEWTSNLNRLHVRGYTPHLIFLDAGLVSTLSPENLRNFLDLFRSVAEFDGARVARLMMERSRTPHTVIDPEGFVKTMQEFLDDVKMNTLKLGNIKVGDILAKVFTMVRQHHIKIEGDFANVGISIVLLEGIGRRLDPDIDLLKEALPILREAASHSRGGAYEPLRELGEGKTYWKVWAYSKLRRVLLRAEWVDVRLFENALIFFPE